MSKFDFFDEGVRRVFDNYELPLDKNAWANFQSGMGAGASSNLLKSFILPGLLVAGLFTALHITTPTTQNHIAEHSSTENAIGHADASINQTETTHTEYSSDLNNNSQTISSESAINTKFTATDAIGNIADVKNVQNDQTTNNSGTVVKTVTKSDKKENQKTTSSNAVREKLPENMASEMDGGTKRTKFLGDKYKLGAPERFTPNKDNSSDNFMPPKLNKDSKFVMRIYDKGGDLVFVSNSVTDPWDGTVLNTNEPAKTGDYHWNVILEQENKRREYGGSVKLVR